MPQMAPYNWLILFSFFNLLMIFMSSINFFILMKKKIPTISNNQNIYYKMKW